MKDSPRSRALREELKQCEATLEQDLATFERKANEAEHYEREKRNDPETHLRTSAIHGNEELIELSRLSSVARDAFINLRSEQARARRRLQEIRGELDCDANVGEAINTLRTLREERAETAVNAKQMTQLCTDLDAEIATLTEDRKVALEARATGEVKARLGGSRLPADTKIADIDRKLETGRATQTTATGMSQAATAAVAEIDEKISRTERRLCQAQYQQALRDWRAASETVMPAAAALLAAERALGTGSRDACEVTPIAEMITAALTALRAQSTPMQAVQTEGAASAQAAVA